MVETTDVAIVGGGPAGLSAALFTAKNGLNTFVFDTNETWMHKAHLFNYLGIESVDGSAFMEAARAQVDEFDVQRNQGELVTSIENGTNGLTVITDRERYATDYIVLATGVKRDLAEHLGCALTENDVVDVDVTMETSVAGVYATGAMVRAEEWEAIISAGDGAAAALNILTIENGEHFHDFDAPADAE